MDMANSKGRSCISIRDLFVCGSHGSILKFLATEPTEETEGKKLNGTASLHQPMNVELINSPEGGAILVATEDTEETEENN